LATKYFIKTRQMIDPMVKDEIGRYCKKVTQSCRYTSHNMSKI